MKRETRFQNKLIEELYKRFPGCLVLKNDPNYKQGIPDLLILYKKKWAMLECKKSKDEPFRPNQELYLERLGYMSFASVIFPENKEEVLNELEKAFGIRRTTCIPISQ
ncbi:MAG: hypothetical protein J6U54_06270 [Clostridiales bacterium]|nr:hypothetical protein [Clostridiales bacterium]